MFEEAVDGRVPGKSLHERPAGFGLLLAGLEDRLEQHQVRYQLDQSVSREVFAGPSALELAFVAGEDRGREILPDMGLVGPRGGQPARLESVTDALPAYRVDHAACVPDRNNPLVVALRAPHPHLERPARGRTFRRGILQPGGQLRLFQKAVVEVFEVPARTGERRRRDARPNVRLPVSEIEHPAVARAVRIHVLRDKDVQILLVGSIYIAEILPTSYGVLVGFHPLAGEASDAI